MVVQTIENIREARDEIREKIKSSDPKSSGDKRYGNENEWDYQGLINELEILLIEVSSHTKAPNQFVRTSTHNERVSLHSILKRICAHITAPANLTSDIDTLKVQLRAFRFAEIPDRSAELEDEFRAVVALKNTAREGVLEANQVVERAKELMVSLDALYEEAEATRDEADVTLSERRGSLEEKITSGDEYRSELASKASELETLVTSLSAIEADVKETQQEAELSLTEIRSTEKLIDSFGQRVQERERRLDEIGESADNFESRLADYEDDRARIVSEAESLIASATKALEYKTAEGISAAFQEERNSISNEPGSSWLWGAFACLLGAIGLGVWNLIDQTASIASVIGRLALIPLPVAGAVFCARRYIARFNLKADYGYKTVLAKSLVGFSEELRRQGGEDPEERSQYIKTVLEEIHQDPLRSRSPRAEKGEKGDQLKTLADLLNRLEKVKKLANPVDS